MKLGVHAVCGHRLYVARIKKRGKFMAIGIWCEGCQKLFRQVAGVCFRPGYWERKFMLYRVEKGKVTAREVDWPDDLDEEI